MLQCNQNQQFCTEIQYKGVNKINYNEGFLSLGPLALEVQSGVREILH